MSSIRYWVKMRELNIHENIKRIYKISCDIHNKLMTHPQYINDPEDTNDPEQLFFNKHFPSFYVYFKHIFFLP